MLFGESRMRRSVRGRLGRAIASTRSALPGFAEGLEPRLLLSTYTVTSTADSGPGSLRDAITNSSADTITFSLSTLPATIAIGSQLDVSRNLMIDGPGPGALTVSGSGRSRVFQIDPGTTVRIQGITIGNGSADDGGGVLNSGNLTLADCTVSNNSASGTVGVGGGVANAGTLLALHCTIAHNTAAASAGGVANAGALTLTNSVVSMNSAATDGGGIANQVGRSVTATDTTISGNAAVTGAGIDNAGSTDLSGCTIAANTAGTAGGGIENEASGTLSLREATCAANNAGAGGGIDTAGTATLTNCTIAQNKGGGVTVRGGDASLYNTIVAANQDQQNAPADIQGALDGKLAPNQPVSSNNLIGPGGSGGLSDGAAGNRVGVADPGLLPLGDYVGPTQTLALRADSPAVDHGSNEFVEAGATDQRGLPRIANGTVDVGAVERQSSFVVNTLDDRPLGSLGPDLVSFRQAVQWANQAGDVADVVIRFDPSLTAAGAVRAIKLDPAQGQIDLNRTTGTVTVQGPGAALLGMSGQNATRVFQVEQGTNAEIDGLTITGGSAPGGTRGNDGGYSQPSG